jgi:subtilisin family serine protease
VAVRTGRSVPVALRAGHAASGGGTRRTRSPRRSDPGVPTLRKLGSFTVSVLLTSSLLVPTAATAAPDDVAAERLQPLTQAQTTAPDEMPIGEGTASREYFVRLAGAPAALHTVSEPGRPASSRIGPDGSYDYQAGSAGAERYEAALEREQVEVASEGAEETVGREVEILASYTVANHGFATEMTPREARALAGHPDVVWVQEFPEYVTTTDRGPAFVNARGGVIAGNDGVWVRPEDGPATGFTGEGVVVGVIDTGINPSSPSFQETTADGYTHQNPRGRYYGSCDPDNDGSPLDPDDSWYGGLPPDAAPYDEDLAELCNGKLIGMWGYDSVSGQRDANNRPIRGTGSPIDYDGHGSHTAGTAAGGFADGVEANVGDTEVPGNSFDVSGVAPHANIISYAACCTGLALLSAIDQMIVDDVDVLNFSIGSTSPTVDLLQDGITWGFLVARLTGIHVANSAGNAGPGSGTIGSPSDAPWVTSVASSTHDRLALNALTGLPAGTFAGGTIEGKGVSGPLADPSEIVYAGDLDGAADNALCLPGVWDADDLAGLIVVCDRGQIGRVAKSEAAAAAGAAGFVLANDAANAGSIQASLNGDSFAIPGVHVTHADGQALKSWIAGADAPTATIAGTSFDVADRWGDTVSIFSSRGPNGHDANLLSPQVTAPGTDILAPYGWDDSTEYQFISGTSMSSPHVAGAFALLVDAFEDELTPAEAQSALQLTARRDVRDTDGVTPADPFDVGSGHIDVAAALATGLVMETDVFDFYDTALFGLDSSELNLASLGQSQCVSTCTWERTFTGAPGTDAVTYDLSATADGYELRVEPPQFTISEGEDVTITVTADVEGARFGDFSFGSVELETAAEGVSDAHLPVVVRPSPFAGPERLELTSEGYVDGTAVTYTAADASGLTVDVSGLAPGVVHDLDVAQDPSPLDPFVGFDEDAVVWLDAPEDVTRIVARVGDTTSPDIDLFVGRDVDGDGVLQGAETVCMSAAGGSEEFCDLLDPEPGSYWVLVQNWESSAARTDAVELITGVVAGDEGNLDVDAPAAVDPGDRFDLGLSWELTAPDRHWFGLLELGSTDATPGEFPVPVDIVVEPEAPVADAGGPYAIVLGENLTLDGSGSAHPEGLPIEAYRWDVSELGIASPQEGETLTVRPSVAGERQVTLTVEVDGIEATDTVTVTVHATPPDPELGACEDVDAVRFPDVPAGPPHGDNVACVAGYGIALGRADGTYQPFGDVRRDQMASFLVRLLRVAGTDVPARPRSSFSDVTGGPHALAIAQLADLGVVEGRADGTYQPRRSVTRAQMASFLVRSLEVVLDRDLTSTGPGPFTDIGGVHADNIRVANELGIAQGRTRTTFAPNRDVRRDQMGSFIARSLDVLDGEGIRLTPLG